MRNYPRRRHELDYVTAFSARRYASAVYAVWYRVYVCLVSISLSVQLKPEFYQNGYNHDTTSARQADSDLAN